jgi:hypothetical protein
MAVMTSIIFTHQPHCQELCTLIAISANSYQPPRCSVLKGAKKMIKPLRLPRFRPIYLVVGACLVATFHLQQFFNLPLVPRERTSPERSFPCQEIVQPKAAVSREQLAQLMSIPERSQRRNVQQILKEPYCQLPSLSIRAGAKTEREIYPLAFDPQTSVVVVYEGEVYVGYGVKAR